MGRQGLCGAIGGGLASHACTQLAAQGMQASGCTDVLLLQVGWAGGGRQGQEGVVVNGG